MAQVQTSSGNPPPPATNGQPTSSSSVPQQVAPISWEGDRMFNVYIHDYFLKRGFRKAAKELVVEAEIGNDASPPINARQGFLFEWWTVFWMFFSAKTTGQGQENVMLYFHWIQTQQAERNRQLHENEQRRAVQQLPLTSQPATRAIARLPPNGVRPPGMVNGTVSMPQAPGQSGSAGQTLQYPMSVPHAPMPPTLQQPPAGAGQPQPQINGVVDPSAAHGHPMANPQPSPSQQQPGRAGTHGPLPQLQQGHPPPSHPSTLPHLQASQRQVSRGQHDPMRGPGHFHSPTMNPAHPAGTGAGQQNTLAVHAPMSGMGGAQPPMGTQHHTQHPHIGRGLPSQPGQPSHVSPRNPSQTPTQPYQPLINHPGTMGHPQGPTSRAETPGTNALTHQSPALAARDAAPQTQGQAVNEEMSRRFQQHQQQQHHQQQQQHRQNQLQEQQDIMNVEQNLARIPPVFLAQMKMEAGVGDRDISTLSYEEKSRLSLVFKRTMATFNGTTSALSQHRTGRPGGPQPPIPGMPMGPPQGPPNTRQPSGRGQKRAASTSPTDEGAGEKDHSPPDTKRRRRSPNTPGNEPGGAAPPMNSMGGFPPNHPVNHPGYPGPQQQNVSNGFRPPPGGQIGGPMPAAGQPVPNIGGMAMVGMTPGMGHAMPPPGMSHMNPALANQHIHQMPNSQNQSQQMHYRQTMAVQHLHKMPGGGIGANAGNPGNTNPSPSLDAHEAARTGPGQGLGSRQPQQGKPGSMMPPPSPAHRSDNSNTQKGAGMMPPPAQPGGSAGNTGGGASKEQTTASPAGRHEGGTGASPGIRPASSAGAATSNTATSGPPSMSQGNNGGGPATPASAGGNNNNSSATTAPSPSAVLNSRISPSAVMNSLPRPQTSGPESSTGSSVPPPPSAPSSSSDLFTNFFEMEDNFGLEAAFPEAIDPTEFSQWINMNPLN